MQRALSGVNALIVFFLAHTHALLHNHKSCHTQITTNVKLRYYNIVLPEVFAYLNKFVYCIRAITVTMTDIILYYYSSCMIQYYVKYKYIIMQTSEGCNMCLCYAIGNSGRFLGEGDEPYNIRPVLTS